MDSSEPTPPPTPKKPNKSRRFSLRNFVRPSSMISTSGTTSKADSSSQPVDDALPPRAVYLGASTSESAPVPTNPPSPSALFKFGSIVASPSASTPIATLAPSNSDNEMHLSQLENYERQMGVQLDMLELLPQRIQVRHLNKDLCEQKAQIFELERESSSAVAGLPQLEMDYTSLKLRYKEQLANFIEMEKTAETLAADSANLPPMEKLKARRAELEVLKLKPDLVRQSIELEEMEIIINEKNSKSATAEATIKELRRGVEEKQLVMANFEEEFKAYHMKFTPYVPGAGQSMANMERFLETAATVLLERLQQIELILEGIAKFKSGMSMEEIEASRSDDPHHLLRPTRATLLKQLEEARVRNEHLIPLFLVGLRVRAKRAEHLARVLRYRKPDNMVLADGTSAALDSNALADATLNLDRHNEVGETSLYSKLYHVDPKTIWTHRDFTMFTELIDMGVDMEEWSHSDNAVFRNNYNTVVNAILPDFKISTDAELKANPELSRAYTLMQRAYKKTAHELRKQPSSGDSMSANGARLD